MTGPPEDPFLIALGSAISDGAKVDWDRAERDANDPATQDIVRGMRQLADLVAAHRSGGGSAAPAPVATAPPARHWRHIVLFETIGAGAFGTVYRGWDPTLDREVAVKLFPRTDTTDPAAPLEEARHLARVRHGNVVVVYGADRDGDEAGIWMEYIEGRTLADMVRVTGPMSAREVIGIGVDLCRALAALHRAGLLHRDIKPHNVMREFGGRIVLMDFSGAQRVARRTASAVNSGTPLFMAPELFESGVASVASEVYSLGILLFFLLSGRLPVEGSSVADLKRAHVRGLRNRLADFRPDVPSALAQVIERALAIDPAARYKTAGEFEHALAHLSGSPAGPAVLVDPGFWRSWKTWAVVAAGIVLGAALTTVKGAPAETTPQVLTRFTIGPPFTSGSWPRVSPDGRYVAFGAIVEGRDRFWVRPLDDVQGRPLMNTTATESPFWSPDGKILCFFEGGKLKRIPIESGTSQSEVLAEAPQARGGDWSGDTIVFSRGDGLHKISLTATPVVEQLTGVDATRGDYQHAWPEFLPDGRQFLFVIRSSQADRAGVYVASIDGGAPRYVMPAHSRVIYADGHVLYVRQGLLMAQPFDARSATLEGHPIPLSDRVKHHASSDGAFDVSTNGVLIFGRLPSDPSTRLMLFDGRGRELRALAPTGHYRHPRFSPDGRRVVAERVDSDEQRNVDLWLYDIERGGASRLTSTPAPDVRPTWSPDGQRIVFASKRGAFYDLFTKTVDTTDAETPLTGTEGDKFIEHWSSDGRFLIGTVLRSGLWVLPLDPGTKPWLFRSGERGGTWQSEFSPDGRWLAYTSQESGSPEVYVEPFPATGARWQVSTQGGAEPHWRKGGRELVYVSPRGILMAVAAAGGWETSRPTELFHINVPDIVGSGDYTVSADGSRIVVNAFISDPVVPPIDVVVNWPALLKR